MNHSYPSRPAATRSGGCRLGKGNRSSETLHWIVALLAYTPWAVNCDTIALPEADYAAGAPCRAPSRAAANAWLAPLSP